MGRRPERGALDALVDELVREASATPRWDCGLLDDGPCNIPFTAADARAALAAVPYAAEWVYFAWLEGANWLSPWLDLGHDHDEPGNVACAACRRRMVDALLWFLVTLHRYVGRQAGAGRVRAEPH